jgi:hypothetical protein
VVKARSISWGPLTSEMRRVKRKAGAAALLPCAPAAHWITWSARMRMDWGNIMPRTLAVSRVGPAKDHLNSGLSGIEMPVSFVRGEGSRACTLRQAQGRPSKRGALPAGPTERGGPPPLSNSPPRTARSSRGVRLKYGRVEDWRSAP